MTIESFKKAEAIQEELTMLKRWIKKCHHISSINMYIKQDGEKDTTTNVPISEELSEEIMDCIKYRIEDLEEEFENI